MSTDQDIRRRETILWNRYSGRAPEQALDQIYQDAQASSDAKRGWYWDNIKNKRWASFVARTAAFLLLVSGTALPLLAGLWDAAATRLICTQIAITVLAVAALIQVADKAFGWSSGWMRYITTATAMESADTAFKLAWTKHLLSKSAAVDAADVQALFALAEQFERDLIKLQTDETSGWITEFNAGITLLDNTIKVQREETQKQLAALQAAATSAQSEVKAQEKARAEADAAARKAQEEGAIDLKLIFKAESKAVTITLDGADVEASYTGTSWSSKVAPGIHVVAVTLAGNANLHARTPVTVEPGKVTKAELTLPF